MNKTQLVDALAERLGDRRTAATALDGLLDTIVTAVGAGESVSITGFGVFEPRARAARVARNPRTGASVDVAATTVPAFRPGTGFRSVVGGAAGPPARRAAPAPARVAAASGAGASGDGVPGAGASDGAAPADAKPPRRAAKGRAFAARPTPEQPVPDAGAGVGTREEPGRRASGKKSGKKESRKDPGKGRKGKGKK